MGGVGAAAFGIVLIPLLALLALLVFDPPGWAPSIAVSWTSPQRRVVSSLKDSFGDRCSIAKADLEAHGKDPSSLDVTPPLAVVYPESTEEVAVAVRMCALAGVSVIPYGAGTSLETNVVPLRSRPTVTIDLSRMDEILELNARDMYVHVQAGLRRHALNAQLERHGVFFPIDPGSDASIGGMLGTGASGPHAVRYGTVRQAAMMLKVVTASGEVVKVGSFAPKSSAGYDLAHLFIGSEGTLGIITEAVIRIHRLPDARAGALARFPSVEQAAAAVQSLRLDHVPLAKIEFVNAVAIAAINLFFKVTYPVQPTLLLEFHGQKGDAPKDGEDDTCEVRNLERQISEVRKLFVDDFGCNGFDVATGAEEMKEMWRIRANAYYANAKLRGDKLICTDTCVPISNFSASVVATERDFEENSFLPYPIVGHVGDGNFHVMIPIFKLNETEQRELRRMYDRLLHRTLDLRGTISGEHGVGIGKRQYLALEHGEAAVEVMRALKCALDPQMTLNPDKVVVAECGVRRLPAGAGPVSSALASVGARIDRVYGRFFSPNR